ncbi:MAG: hypothetical protein NTX71_06530 [Candidatus Aureabacteria bacterium]|nr:hypothetical protein [Candidatus Auribacterota bacterium]
MDRFQLLCVALSTGLHTVLIAHLPPVVSKEAGQAFPPAIEFSYIEAVGGPAGGEHVPHPGEAGDDSSIASLREVGQDQARADSQVLKGTGEILSGVTRETLRPLSPREIRSSEAFTAAVNRYRKQLEQILEREGKLSYPHIALESGREARLQVRFCVRGDGALESIEVPPACGGFDRELVAGLKKAAVCFPAFPEEIKCEKLTFCWPVSFDLR